MVLPAIAAALPAIGRVAAPLLARAGVTGAAEGAAGAGGGGGMLSQVGRMAMSPGGVNIMGTVAGKAVKGFQSINNAANDAKVMGEANARQIGSYLNPNQFG